MHQAKLLHPPAQKDPDIDLIEKFTLKVALEQDAITKRVESGNVRAGFEAGQIMAYAALHFSRSLVREGQRQNVFRLKPAHIFQQVDDALRDDARFAASGPGDHQQWSLAMLHCVPLFGVEIIHAGSRDIISPSASQGKG